MKNSTKHIVFFLAGFIFLAVNLNGQENIITLKSLPGGSEGNTKYTDKSVIYITPSGLAVYRDNDEFSDFSVTSSLITTSSALDKTFDVLLGGMATVNTKEGKDYGSKLTDGGLDRASNGNLGVRGGFGNAIDKNEGLYFGLDLSKMDASVSIQITKIYINFAGLPNEKGIIVSKINPLKKISFGTESGVDFTLTNDEEEIDISSLNLYITDREVNTNMLSVFNDSSEPNNFRVTGLELKILDNKLDVTKVSSLQHPRLLLKKGDEALIHNLINQSTDFNELHNYIVSIADDYLTSPNLVKPATGRILNVSRDAIFQLFYLSYAYRMTNEIKYLTKGESVLNTICDFDNWYNYTLDTAEMCFAAAIGYDWLYDGLSNATKEKARNSILNFALIPEKFKSFWESASNWNQVGIGGLSFGALAILGDGNTSMDTQATYYLNNILIKNPKSMNTYASGNYQEGAMYWSYGTTFEVMMLSALEEIFGENHEGINRLTYSQGFLESAEYMQYVTGPTSLYFNYMDSTQKRSHLPATFWMAKKSNDTSIISEEKKLLKNGGYLTTSIEESRFLPIALIYAKDINFDNLQQPQKKMWVGYGDQPVALTRTKWQGSTGKYFGIKAGTPTYSHGQMDGGAFVYDSQGLRWATDFGKYDYEAVGSYLASLNPPKSLSDFSQNSPRWNIFKVGNLNHNTLSVKKSLDTKWQLHKADGEATIDELFDTDEKRGAKVNLKPVIGLNNELNEIFRSTYLVNDEYLEIKDEIKNGNESVDVYWNMVTTGLVEKLDNSRIKLTQGGKTVVLEIVSNNANVPFTIQENRSTDPVDYYPTATYERKNEDATMVGFIATIPANESVTFTVTLKDGAIVPPSTPLATNEILLEIPNPITGLEGNFKYSDNSIFHFDEQNQASISGFSNEYAWNVYGTSNISNTLNTEFKFVWSAMGATNTNAGADYGAILTPSGIDRDSGGNLGVRIGSSTGIDPNEGFNVGFDLKGMPNSTSLQLIKIGLDFFNGTESGEIVNRKDTTKKLTFGASDLNNGFVDVESLGITINGGETNLDMASIFSTSSSGAYRINKFVFKVGGAVLSVDNLNDISKNITIYPNPFNDSFMIKNPNRISDAIQVQIFNILGTRVLNITKNIDDKIMVNQLEKGIYLVKIKNGTTTTHKKIIKN